MELPMTSNPIHHSGDAIPASKNEALKPQRHAVDKFTRSLVVSLGLVITALVATVAALAELALVVAMTVVDKAAQRAKAEVVAV